MVSSSISRVSKTMPSLLSSNGVSSDMKCVHGLSYSALTIMRSMSVCRVSSRRWAHRSIEATRPSTQIVRSRRELTLHIEHCDVL